MFTLIFAILPIVIVAIVVGRGVAVFAKAEGTLLERLWATSRDSATWFCAKVTAVGGWVIIGIDNLSQVVGQDQVGEFVKTNLPPQWVGWGLLGIAVMFGLARLRSLRGAG